METAMDANGISRLRNCRQALEKNNFQVFFAEDPGHARDIFFEQVLPGLQVKPVSWGDSLTLQAAGILDHFRRDPAAGTVKARTGSATCGASSKNLTLPAGSR